MGIIRQITMPTIALFAAAIIVAQAPQEAPLDREQVRQELIQLTSKGCGFEGVERRKRLAQISSAALEELPGMVKESRGEQLLGLLRLYQVIAESKVPAETPVVIINLARGGTGHENLAAAKIALMIGDDRAISFLIDGLNRFAAGEATEWGYLETLLLDRAGWCHSMEAGDLVTKLLSHPDAQRKLEAVDALGNMGHAPALEALKKMSGEKYPIPGRAREAIVKIELLAPTGRTAKLLETVRGMRAGGEFSWSRWALHQIVYFKLTDAAAPLRVGYDEFQGKYGTPKFGTEWSAVLLHAIHKLGGKLSAEETALLHDLGILHPAVRRGTPEEEFVKGFDKSVWAPREVRLKEHQARLKEEEVRRAPPPRIPEEKLPRFMDDRIRFVMNLEKPDPSYLAPNAVSAMGKIEEMLATVRDKEEQDKLLTAYLYLAQLREGMKTPDIILELARAPNRRPLAIRIVTTIADDRAEAWFLEEMKDRHASHIAHHSGRLAGPKVRERLLKFFREASSHERFYVLRALADLGCVELLPELKAEKTNPTDLRLSIEKLEILASSDRDRKLLELAKSFRMGGDFSYYGWARDQIVQLNLKHLAPELRTWFDKAKERWVNPSDPTGARAQVIHALYKLGAPITPDEEALLKKCGRLP